MASQKVVYDQITGCTVNATIDNMKICKLEITKLFIIWMYDPISAIAKSFEKGFTKGFADGEFTDLIKKALESPDRHVFNSEYTQIKYNNDNNDDLSDTCQIM